MLPEQHDRLFGLRDPVDLILDTLTACAGVCQLPAANREEGVEDLRPAFSADLDSFADLQDSCSTAAQGKMAEQHSARFASSSLDQEKGDALYKENTLATTDRSSTGYAASTAGLDHKHQNAVSERKLLFKLDILILPLCMMLYLSAYLDRGNMGNAKLQGLEAGVLGGDDNLYSGMFESP